MDAEQLHPPPGEGPVATADERRNIAGLDNVVNVLHVFLLVKKLPARKNELLHAFVRDDTVARMTGEPIVMWLVRFCEQLGKLNRVGVDIVTALPDVAGRQGLNLAVLTEDRIERVVSRLPDDTFPLDKFSAELDRVFASVHMSEPVSWTPAIPPGRAWNSNERNVLFYLRGRIIAGDNPDRLLQQKGPDINPELLRPHSGTRLKSLKTRKERTMTAAVTPLIRATCKNTCETSSRYTGQMRGQWRERGPDSRCGRFSAGNRVSKTFGIA